jgi:hypothetical protein
LKKQYFTRMTSMIFGWGLKGSSPPCQVAVADYGLPGLITKIESLPILRFCAISLTCYRLGRCGWVRVGFARRVYRFSTSTWGTFWLCECTHRCGCRTCGGHARHGGGSAGAGGGSAGTGAAGAQSGTTCGQNERHRQQKRSEDVARAPTKHSCRSSLPLMENRLGIDVQAWAKVPAAQAQPLCHLLKQTAASDIALAARTERFDCPRNEPASCSKFTAAFRSRSSTRPQTWQRKTRVESVSSSSTHPLPLHHLLERSQRSASPQL